MSVQRGRLDHAAYTTSALRAHLQLEPQLAVVVIQGSGIEEQAESPVIALVPNVYVYANPPHPRTPRNQASQATAVVKKAIIRGA